MDNVFRIGLINLGISNLASVRRMLERVGAKVTLIEKAGQLKEVSRVILPGVGHFDEGVKQLQNTGLSGVISDLARERQISILGICLGMQLLCLDSEEGRMPGLGLVDATVKKFRSSSNQSLRVPHMGWNVLHTDKPNSLVPQGFEEQRFYFVHSYKVVPSTPAITIGTADYGGKFCAAFQKDNIFGVQFHPEKSHRFGMALMRRFVEL